VAIVVAAAAIVLFLPIRFPSSVGTHAGISAARKWILMKGTDGQLIARTFNYESGMSDGYRVSNFNAGSSISFAVNPSLAPGQHIEIGDTVGWVSSSEMQERLVVLNGQLAAAQRQLEVNATGQKAEVVNEAQQRLEAAKRRRAEYQVTVERTQTMLDGNLIAHREYERVISESHVLDDAITLAQANLDVARSGAKPEQIALIEANIVAIREEIRAIHAKASGYTVRAPIEGTIAATFAGDTLLTIAASRHYVALIPIRWSDYPRVAAVHAAAVTIPGFSRPVHGKVIALGHEVQALGNERVVMATALLDEPPADLLPGSLVRCTIGCRPLTAREYVALAARSVATAGSLGSY
jgi:hypothetical protein